MLAPGVQHCGGRSSCRCIALIVWIWLCLSTLTESQDLTKIMSEVGGTMCRYLAMRGQVSRKWYGKCEEPTCRWGNWNKAHEYNTKTTARKKERVILSYSHNGFGNQLWQHSVAFMIAESMRARLIIQMIPDSLSPEGYIPPNTWSGYNVMRRLLPAEFTYESLAENSDIRSLCDTEHFFVSDRPRDWRDKNYSANFKTNLYNLVTDPEPRCLKMLGYFQNLPLCAEDTKQLWTPRMLANYTMRPGVNDISIYLRCVPRHYHFNDKTFYQTILDNTKFEKVWLFTAPECPSRLGDDAKKDGVVAGVVRLLLERYNATHWPKYPRAPDGNQEDDDASSLMHDLAGLASSKKLILPVSSWAYWAGMFSNASEIHVNAPPFHQVMNGMNQYVYHYDKGGSKQFFGRLNAKGDDIEYGLELVPASAPAGGSGKSGEMVWKRDAKRMSYFENNWGNKTASMAADVGIFEVGADASKSSATTSNNASALPSVISANSLSSTNNSFSSSNISASLGENRVDANSSVSLNFGQRFEYGNKSYEFPIFLAFERPFKLL